MVQLPEVEIKEVNHPRHNYYYPSKFFERKEFGNLVDKYQNRAMFVTEDFMMGFQYALEEELGDAAGEIMYRCGYEWGKKDIQSFSVRMEEEFGRSIKKMNFGMVLETWWWPLQVSGWGAWKYDLSNRKQGMIFVDLYDSAVAATIGNVGKVVCHYYAGMFAAVFGHLANHELSGIEIQCLSMGEDYCKFLVGSSKRVNAAQFWVREGANAKEVISKL